MSGRTVALVAGGVVVAAVVVGLVVAGGSEPEAPTATQAIVATTAPPTTQAEVAETAAAAPDTAEAPEAVATETPCTSTQEPHIMATGLITSIDGVPIAPPGQYAGDWFSLGNAVSITVPEAGGPAFVTLVAALSTDAGAIQTYNVGHDSRAAYPPPDARAPENYLAFDAATGRLDGTVGLSVEALEAGQVPSIEPAEFTSSTFMAAYDTGFTGTVTHPDFVVEFTATMVTMSDQPVFSSPECYQGAVESARESDSAP